MSQLIHILEELKNGNIGLFFGAGMSFNSGIPTVHTIERKILETINLGQYSEQIIKLNYPFELFMEEFSKYIDITKFLDIFKEGQPNHFHQLVWKLYRYDLLRKLMTTNFDLLIEKSELKNKLNIIDRESKFRSFDQNSDSIDFIKIHGSISNKATIRTTMSQIFKEELRNGRKAILKQFFEDINTNYIIILGYSCSDFIDISPVIESITDSKIKILFIEHSRSYTIKYKDIRNHKLFKRFDGYWLTCNTDSFLQKLHSEFFTSTLNTISYNFNIEKYFDFKLIRKGTPELIVSNIFFKNSHFKISKKILEDILSTEDIDDDIRAEMDVQLLEIYYNLYLKRKIIKETLLTTHTNFENAIKYYGETNNNYGLGQSYNHWGHILGALRKYKKALYAYEKASEYFAKDGNKYRLAQIQNNNGHINLSLYKKTKKENYFAKAKSYFTDSYKYFNKSGKIFEYSISLYNLGCLWILKPEKKDIALRYFKSSLQLAKEIKDKEGIKLCNKEINKITTANKELSLKPNKNP
nr:SIR2 family protein [uncultured Draconibacterium sp.]